MHAPCRLAVKYPTGIRRESPAGRAAGPRLAAAAAPEQHLSNASFVTGTAACRQYRGPRPLGARRGQQGRQKGLEGTGELRLRARVIGRRGSHHVSARLGAENKSMGREWASDADALRDGVLAVQQRLSQHREVVLYGCGGQALLLPCPASAQFSATSPPDSS
ncbi:hypothetical protein TgHK011_008798 [Trichoderma gracile]|nr:hypothetical protein TgHK011_008798 [Trichoderma gracile]